MPRILVISNIPTPYNDAFFSEVTLRPGVELHVAYCARQERNRSWTLSAAKGYDYSVLRGVTLGHAGHFNPGVARLITRHHPDVVVLSGSYAMPTAQVAMALLRWRHVPWLYWGEELQYGPMSRPRRALRDMLRRGLRGADGVLAIGTRALESYARAGISTDRIANFHYYADTARFVAASRDRAGARAEITARFRIDPSSTIFLFVGQLIPRKGVMTLMEAHRQLRREGVKSVLVIAGDGPMHSVLRADAQTIDEGRSVHFTGFVQPDSLPRLFAACDCFVLPSTSEGWGIVVPESMAAGTPVISSDRVNAGLDLIDPDRSGYLFRAGDATDLARVMRLMADSETKRRDLSENAQAAMTQETPTVAAQRFVEIAEAALRGERIEQVRHAA